MRARLFSFPLQLTLPSFPSSDASIFPFVNNMMEDLLHNVEKSRIGAYGGLIGEFEEDEKGLSSDPSHVEAHLLLPFPRPFVASNSIRIHLCYLSSPRYVSLGPVERQGCVHEQEEASRGPRMTRSSCSLLTLSFLHLLACSRQETHHSDRTLGKCPLLAAVRSQQELLVGFLCEDFGYVKDDSVLFLERKRAHFLHGTRWILCRWTFKWERFCYPSCFGRDHRQVERRTRSVNGMLFPQPS